MGACFKKVRKIFNSKALGEVPKLIEEVVEFAEICAEEIKTPVNSSSDESDTEEIKKTNINNS
jgi:hypothetical protein